MKGNMLQNPFDGMVFSEMMDIEDMVNISCSGGPKCLSKGELLDANSTVVLLFTSVKFYLWGLVFYTPSPPWICLKYNGISIHSSILIAITKIVCSRSDQWELNDRFLKFQGAVMFKRDQISWSWTLKNDRDHIPRTVKNVVLISKILPYSRFFPEITSTPICIPY